MYLEMGGKYNNEYFKTKKEYRKWKTQKIKLLNIKM